MSVVKACTFDIRPRRLAFGLFAGPSSSEWAWSRTMGQFTWQSNSGQMTGQWQKTIIYQYSRVGKLRASQRDTSLYLHFFTVTCNIEIAGSGLACEATRTPICMFSLTSVTIGNLHCVTHPI